MRVTLAQIAKGRTSGRNPRHLQDHASPQSVLDWLGDSLIVGCRRGHTGRMVQQKGQAPVRHFRHWLITTLSCDIEGPLSRCGVDRGD